MKSYSNNRKLQYRHGNDTVYTSFFLLFCSGIRVVHAILDDSLARQAREVMNLFQYEDITAVRLYATGISDRK